MSGGTVNSARYVGRFAPSPTGPLHFGSLIAALASFLDARSHNGQWLVRMEDIDEPRCVAGADRLILETLQAHGLYWDGEVVYQSQRHPHYQRILEDLLATGQAYYCTCTRKLIKTQGGAYPGTCRQAHNPPEQAAVRLTLDEPVKHFVDGVQGDVTICDPHALEDTLIKRRDGLFAYNLVVVLDDIDQGVTHIVRGSDLLDTTAAHLSLYQRLGKPAPRYAHIPVAASAHGRKFSKQNHAPALDITQPQTNLRQALRFLNLTPSWPAAEDSVERLLAWGIARWDYKTLPHCSEIIVAAGDSPYHIGL